MSFQPVRQVDAGPALPQPTKVKDEGQKYFQGRGVRDAPDQDAQIIALGERDLASSSAASSSAASSSSSMKGEVDRHPEAASSSAAMPSAEMERWLAPQVPSLQPAQPKSVPPPTRILPAQPKTVPPRPGFPAAAQPPQIWSAPAWTWQETEAWYGSSSGGWEEGWQQWHGWHGKHSGWSQR